MYALARVFFAKVRYRDLRRTFKEFDVMTHDGSVELGNDTSDSVEMLRRVGFAEGVSYLVLLGIAMPIKYVMGEPIVVRIVGALHGLLFMWYILQGVAVGRSRGWSLKSYLLLVLASILPCGPFLFDRRLKNGS